MKIKLGESLTHTFKIEEADINNFALLSGDTQPIHTDDTFSKRTIFRKKIAHGMLTLMPLTRILGVSFPDVNNGEYVIIKKIDQIEFLGTVYPGDTIDMTLTLDKEVGKNEFFFLAVWKKKEKIILTAEVTLRLRYICKVKNNKS